MIVIGIALLTSPQAQRRIAEINSDINANSGQTAGGETISTASRLDFWSKAVGFVKASPIAGHGTGSIKPLYQSMEATKPSPYGQATPDPHNQTLHTVLQVGLIGGLLLWAMWIAHARLFLARDYASILGQAVVLQNVIGSFQQSHLGGDARDAVLSGSGIARRVGAQCSIRNDRPKAANYFSFSHRFK
jgi:O-antigen ligase